MVINVFVRFIIAGRVGRLVPSSALASIPGLDSASSMVAVSVPVSVATVVDRIVSARGEGEVGACSSDSSPGEEAICPRTLCSDAEASPSSNVDPPAAESASELLDETARAPFPRDDGGGVDRLERLVVGRLANDCELLRLREDLPRLLRPFF